MSRTSKYIVQLAYLYLISPIFIFITGWCNTPTALIGAIILLISFYYTCQNAPSLWIPQDAREKRLLIMVGLLSLVWVYLSGIGALVFQNSDHWFRNPLFDTLVQAPWPVTLQEPSVLATYYLAFWMPSAVVGKLFHSVQIGFYAQSVWAFLGIMLFFYLLLSVLKRKTYWPILLFIFFSGLDALGCLVMGLPGFLVHPTSHLEWWYPFFQFSSFTTQLFWVFNQALPTWVAIMLMYHEKNNKNLLFLYSCMFLHSTFPAVGAFPLVLFWYIKNGKTYTYLRTALLNLKRVIQESITFQNIVGALFVVLISFVYLFGNNSGGQIDIISRFSHTSIWHWLVAFFLPEVGIFLLLIWKYQRRNFLYYYATGCFLLYPLIMIGNGPDFCMRATIPALVLLYIMVVQTLSSVSFRTSNRLYTVLLILALGIGSITPLHEFARTIYFTRLGMTHSPSYFQLQTFWGWKDNNLFLKWFGKYSPDWQVDVPWR